jgi:hypothetical protein
MEGVAPIAARARRAAILVHANNSACCRRGARSLSIGSRTTQGRNPFRLNRSSPGAAFTPHDHPVDAREVNLPEILFSFSAAQATEGLETKSEAASKSPA